jgi:2-aminophenol/2-amino-5-chlorophenol 1,6-dioxygenase alpha subunit
MTQHKSSNPVLKGFVLPGLVQPLLSPDANPGYRKVRAAFDKVREEIERSDADLILIYSTMWPSILGHQIQAMPEPEWTLVDEEFHDLGTIPYKLKIDSGFAECYNHHAKLRGLHSRTIAYHGFPIDTGSVVALKLINPNNRLPAVIVSSNIYADRAETVVLAKAAVSALKEQGKRAIAVIISTLSNRLHSEFIDPKDDKINSLKDQEWNLKILEFLEKGRLEDVAQLSRQIQREARVKKVSNFKPFWWLSSVMGSHNRYTGQIYEYQPIYGTGCAVVGLTPALQAARDLEFDEDAPDYYTGERNVLSVSGESAADFSALPNLYNNLEGEALTAETDHENF